MASSTKKAGKTEGTEAQAAILNTFQQMRKDQRKLITKISELESDRNEHKLVVQALKDTPPERRCFRMVGGVLIERTVKEVQPALEDSVAQLEKIIDALKQELEKKGREINQYREKHNIRFKGELAPSDKKESQDTPSQGGILVPS
jgi:prefoldin subunit 2